MRRAHRWAAVGLLLASSVLLADREAAAQSVDQFGVQARADAAKRMIVLAVQQGISSLPPTSGQSLTYVFDEADLTYVVSERLGPTSFRSPQLMGPGRLSLRVAGSYFDLAETFQPIDYAISGVGLPADYCTRFGLAASATVGLFNFAATYGLFDRIELNLNAPVVVTSVSGSEIFLALNPQSDMPSAVPCSQLPRAVSSGLLKVVKRNFSDIALPQGDVNFREGTSVGLGRISLGAKVALYNGEQLQFALMPEIYLPSPSEDEYAGSASGAFLARLVAQYVVMPVWRLHVDVGYDADFDLNELSGFTWNTGTSFAISGTYPWTVDFGVGGWQFNQGIEWTPSQASFAQFGGSTGQLRALGNNRLGSTFVDFLAGIKVRLTERSVVSGAVNVPLNDEGFRAAAVGTIAVEYYF